jgi:hypothetical protein
MKKFLQLLVIITVNCSLSAVLSSCTKDAYEKGEGKYSYMRGDFAEAVVNSSKQVTGIITDDGDEYTLTAPYTAKWVAKADTTYRCMLYYNKVDNKAEILSIGQVPCAAVIPLSKFDCRLVTDPVKFESTWMSKTGRYLNLSLLLKTGVTDDTTAIHDLAIVSDTIITHPDNKRIRHLILHHDQNNVPEYYSTQVYISIPTKRIDADSVRISINSYDGEVVAKHRIR